MSDTEGWKFLWQETMTEGWKKYRKSRIMEGDMYADISKYYRGSKDAKFSLNSSSVNKTPVWSLSVMHVLQDRAPAVRYPKKESAKD